MAKSPLIYLEVPAHPSNYTVDRYYKNQTTGVTTRLPIRCVTIHHMAGVLSAKSCGGIFANPNRNGSTHYGIGNDGEIANYVDEANTAWGNSNWKSNCESVSIETSNSQRGGNWPVSDAALNSLIKLVADIAKRNNLGKLIKGDNLTWHGLVADKNRPTDCPGEYLRGKLDEIVARANALNGYGDAPKTEEPKPTTKPTETKKSNEQMADEVIAGKWGNGDERKTRLAEAGYDYAAIQAIVNAKLAPKATTPKSEASTTNAIKSGDRVTLISWVDEKGIKLKKTRDFYYASDIKGERVVLRADSMSGAVYAAVNIKNLRKA